MAISPSPPSDQDKRDIIGKNVMASGNRKLMVMAVIDRVREMQPVTETKLIASLCVGEPYMSLEKAKEIVITLFDAGTITYNKEKLLCLK